MDTCKCTLIMWQIIAGIHILLRKKGKSCPLFERVKEQPYVISNMFGVQGRECIYYKTRNMHFVLTHTTEQRKWIQRHK